MNHNSDTFNPLPDIDVVDFKKRNSPETQLYLDSLVTFAKETGIWQVILDALAKDSFFVNKSDQDISVPDTVSTLPAKNSQGLVLTGYEGSQVENLEILDISQDQELLDQTLRAMLFHLSLYNHPQYLDNLYQTAQQPYQPPSNQFNLIMFWAELTKQSLSIHDLTLAIAAADKPRLSRTKVFTQLLMSSYWREKITWWQKLLGRKGSKSGREQARNLFVVGENPEVTGSPTMLAVLAATHHLVGLPRDGKFSNVENQAGLAADTILLLEDLVKLVGRDVEEQQKLLDWFTHNLVGVVEPIPEKARDRARALYRVGIRTFRVYSPEPNNQLVATVESLREMQLQENWDEIEIFAGQVVSVDQAQELEKVGADAIYLGVGGGGRCITGEVASLAIDWVQLLWKLRGKISIPVIVQGGGNDNPVAAITLGATGIGVVGKLAANIESPGGSLYFYDPSSGAIFNYYGGEASNRMRAMVDRVDPLGRAINTEGETTTKQMHYSPQEGIFPTALQRLAELDEILATSFVFQAAESLEDLRQKSPQNLRRESVFMSQSRGSH